VKFIAVILFLVVVFVCILYFFSDNENKSRYKSPEWARFFASEKLFPSGNFILHDGKVRSLDWLATTLKNSGADRVPVDIWKKHLDLQCFVMSLFSQKAMKNP